MQHHLHLKLSRCSSSSPAHQFTTAQLARLTSTCSLKLELLQMERPSPGLVRSSTIQVFYYSSLFVSIYISSSVACLLCMVHRISLVFSHRVFECEAHLMQSSEDLPRHLLRSVSDSGLFKMAFCPRCLGRIRQVLPSTLHSVCCVSAIKNSNLFLSTSSLSR